MGLFSIIVFFAIIWGLGTTLTSFVKNPDNWYERNIMRSGIGLASFIVLGTIMNLVHIPIDWKIFLVLALIYPVFDMVKNKNIELPTVRITNANIAIFLAILIFFLSLFMYYKGAMAYPHLEDDDPWNYALGASYIAEQKTLYAPEGQQSMFRYLDPYPPAYEMIMGVMHQISSSVSWTLKFFNALILSLGLLFFFFFAKNFMKSRNRALFATFVLASVPAFYTHFIWAISLMAGLLFVAMYCLQKIDVDKRWLWPAGIAVGAIFLTHITQTFKVGIMLGLFFLAKWIVTKKFPTKVFASFIIGGVLSLSWWATKLGAMLTMSSTIATEKYGLDGSTSFISRIMGMFPPTSGTATKAYSFSDFFITQYRGVGINVHIGIGIVVSLIFLVGIIILLWRYKELFKSTWKLTAVFWLIFTFLAVNSMTFNLPIGLWAFRTWHFLAIPVALISASGLWFLFQKGKKYSVPGVIILVVVVAGIFFTSTMQKYQHNTDSGWPAGASWQYARDSNGNIFSPELNLYLSLKTLPEDASVFTYSTRGYFVIGMDKYSCEWCPEVYDFRRNLIDKDLEDTYTMLKQQGYDYMVISGMSYLYTGREFGEEEAQQHVDGIIAQLMNTSSFTPVNQIEGSGVILAVN